MYRLTPLRYVDWFLQILITPDEYISIAASVPVVFPRFRREKPHEGSEGRQALRKP